ncbi:hypothetical protein ACW5UC_26535 [Priestia aryabhattai]|uniref:hypothetical protein n=1 Tax=Priestia megaterium TaxID=1404 RepID=UPI003F974990
MFHNVKRTLIIMKLILQDVLQINSLVPPYSSTFTKIAFPVPEPPGISDLPLFIYFDIDNRFTLAQQQWIRDAINGVLFQWFQHLTEKWNGGSNNGISQLANCTNLYAVRNLRPTWYLGLPIHNGLAATNIAMDQFTRLIRDNGFGLAPQAKIFSNISFPANSSTIFALTTLAQSQVPLSLIVNPAQLDSSDLNIKFLTGSMFHAWLHRAGFYHPKKSGHFIIECPMCIMRGFQIKETITPDSFYIQFLD